MNHVYRKLLVPLGIITQSHLLLGNMRVFLIPDDARSTASRKIVAVNTMWSRSWGVNVQPDRIKMVKSIVMLFI